MSHKVWRCGELRPNDELARDPLCLIFDSAILQLVAYIGERERLHGKHLPVNLEALFEDDRFCPLLFRGGRQNNLEDCETGIKMWSDPQWILEDLPLTQHMIGAKCKSTIAEGIILTKGSVTQNMVKRPRKRTRAVPGLGAQPP
jgi:hypothetical protein